MHVQYLSTNVQRGPTRNYHRFVGSRCSPRTLIPSLSSFDYTISLLVVSFIIGLTLDRIHPSSADSFFLYLRATSPRNLWLAFAGGAVFSGYITLLPGGYCRPARFDTNLVDSYWRPRISHAKPNQIYRSRIYLVVVVGLYPFDGRLPASVASR
jgi:hypothetical protein